MLLASRSTLSDSSSTEVCSATTRALLGRPWRGRRIPGGLPGDFKAPVLKELAESLNRGEEHHFSVPSMGVGFSISLENAEDDQPALAVESYSRACDASLQWHMITSDGAILVAKLFL
mmetsp:Transcript_31596/g.86995  ORF Transcript_31596/g.86995 Transcript_31596/m.86995 type:complete len:118 (-) Transcript_31596:162-515(-)